MALLSLDSGGLDGPRCPRPGYSCSIVAVTGRDEARLCVRDHGCFCPTGMIQGMTIIHPRDYRPRHGDATINARANWFATGKRVSFLVMIVGSLHCLRTVEIAGAIKRGEGGREGKSRRWIRGDRLDFDNNDASVMCKLWWIIDRLFECKRYYNKCLFDWSMTIINKFFR